jgi:secreted Zn-dependent insulinase-like peptidase
LPRYFDAEAITALIQQLTPEVVRIFWYSKQFEGKTSEKEPWYGTDYIIERIDKKLLEDWTTAFIDGNLCLPSQNLFIPTDFSIRDPAPKVVTALPALVTSLTIQGTYIWSFYYWQYSVQIFIPNGGTSK